MGRRRGEAPVRLEQLTPQARAFFQQQNKAALGSLAGQFQQAINALGSVVNNLGLRLESLIHALQKGEILTAEDMSIAFREFLQFREELQRLSNVGGMEKYEEFKKWNEREGVRQISPLELSLHRWLLEDRSLTLDERVSVCEELGFGEPLMEEILNRYSREDQSDPIVDVGDTDGDRGGEEGRSGMTEKRSGLIITP